MNYAKLNIDEVGIKQSITRESFIEQTLAVARGDCPSIWEETIRICAGEIYDELVKNGDLPLYVQNRIREKYAELRWRYSLTGKGFEQYDSYNAIIDKYRTLLKTTCSGCGKTGKWMMYDGWEYVLCDDCAKPLMEKERRNQKFCVSANTIEFFGDIGLKRVDRCDIQRAVNLWREKNENHFRDEFYISAINALSGKKNQISTELLIDKIITPEGVEELGGSCFENAPVKRIILPTTLKMLPPECFCLSKITIAWIPESVQEVKWGAVFAKCENLREAKVYAIIDCLPCNFFNGCSALTLIYLPNTIEIFSEFCFAGCSSLQKLYIPEKLKRIERQAFRDCVSLRKIFLPSSVEFIADDAFVGCSNELVFECDGYAFEILKERRHNVYAKQ